MSGPKITDHALLRFLERGCGLDVDGLRDTLQDSLARAHHAAEQLGQTDYQVKVGTSTFVVRGGKLKTVLPTASAGTQAKRLKHK